MRSQTVKLLAEECGFDLAGIAAAEPLPEAEYYEQWGRAGMAGEMRYLTDRRGDIRKNPQLLLPSVRSIICVAKVYNTPKPYSTAFKQVGQGWISRYAWGQDYHSAMRVALKQLEQRLRDNSAALSECKLCVDTAPLLERAYARRAGLGWIAKNTCLINQVAGSWLFLAELLVSQELEPDAPPPDRCGTCRRCIDACPTQAIVPTGRTTAPFFAVDSRRCISYFTIEFAGRIPETIRDKMGSHVFGCDICQDVCPWNRRAPVTNETSFSARHFAPPLGELAALGEEEFRLKFVGSPVLRAKYAGFLRNVVVAMGNSGLPTCRAPLERLSLSTDSVVAEHASHALKQLR